VQNTSHQRRPRTSTTPENIAAVHDLIEGDRQLSVVEICQELGISYGSVQSIIKNELQFRKISARWVPRLLSDQQKMPDPIPQP
jgi:histone-lysine N-methyltransferase SETMAR